MQDCFNCQLAELKTCARFTFTQNIVERLDAGEIVIGDGGFVFALEKRGYVKAGPWTPEAAAEHPEAGKPPHCFPSSSVNPVWWQIRWEQRNNRHLLVAVRQLHREFLRAGANVMQTFTFYASDDKLENRGHTQRFTVSILPETFLALRRPTCACPLGGPPSRSCAEDLWELKKRERGRNLWLKTHFWHLNWLLWQFLVSLILKTCHLAISSDLWRHRFRSEYLNILHNFHSFSSFESCNTDFRTTWQSRRRWTQFWPLKTDILVRTWGKYDQEK